MDCERVAKIAFLVIDEEMDEHLILDLRQHLSRCPDCSQRVLFTRRIFLLVRRRCHRRPAPDRLRQRILTSLPHRNSENRPT